MTFFDVGLTCLENKTLQIGRVGENLRTQVRFNCGEIFGEYPNATVGLTVQPPVGNGYPAVAERDGDIVTWNVLASDLIYEGFGRVQLTFTNGEEIVKTVIGQTMILPSLNPTGEMPEPVDNWIDQANEKLSEVEAWADFTASAETLAPGQPATAEVTEVDGHKNILIGVPEGEKGDQGIQGEPGQDGEDGFSPVVTVTDITGGHRVSVTDADGTKTFDVMDGVDGAPGKDGKDGADGQDGFSPVVTVTDITGGHRVAITDAEGTQTFDVLNGQNGAPGADGYSPTATVAKSGGTATISITDKNGTTTAQVSDGDPTTLIDDTSTASDKTWSAEKLAADNSALLSEIVQKAPVIINTASGDIATFADGADSMPVQKLVVNIDPVQASGTPSPENPLPISGRTGAKIYRTGKNLFGGTLLRDGVIALMPSATDHPDEKYVEFSASAAIATGSPGITQDLTDKFKENTVYTFVITYNKSNNNTASNLRIVYTDGTYTNVPELTTAQTKETVIVASSANKTVSRLGKTNSSGSTYLYYDESGIFEGTLTASDFVPYVGQTYAVSWETEAGTVYGGNLNVTTGVLTVDRVKQAYNGQENWFVGDEDRGFYSPLKTIYRNSHTPMSNMFNALAPGGSSSMSIGDIRLNSGFKNLLVYTDPSDFQTVDSWKTFLATTNLEVIHRITEPTVIQLTPVEVATLMGYNAIYADCGSVSVDYRTDTKSYVDDAIPAVPVQDVQIDGTSILNNGVANVPVASDSTPGVVKISNYNGTGIGASRSVFVVRSTDAEVKAGTQRYKPIVPESQHQSVFYGLAKLAGVDLASGSDTVGVYPDAAKIAIQKMLGIYEAPWELIREDTFTNATEADHIITVDGNGNALSITSAIMLFELPNTDTASSKGYYGQIWFYYGDTVHIDPEPSAYSRNANDAAKGAWYKVEYNNGLVLTESTPATTNTNSTNLRMRFIHSANASADSQMGVFVTNDFEINKINIKNVTGTGHYKLYGRRKWTA